MLTLKAFLRKEKGKQNKKLRKEGWIPAILYGEKIKNTPLKVKEEDFNRIYKKAGESSLIALETENGKVEVLIYDILKDPLKGKILHIDFYHPSVKKEVSAEIPLVFVGKSEAIDNLGGVLVKELQTLEVKGLPQRLPREIKVDISLLKTFEDRILVKDLNLPEGITPLRDKQDIVCLVTPPEQEQEIEETASQQKEDTLKESSQQSQSS